MNIKNTINKENQKCFCSICEILLEQRCCQTLIFLYALYYLLIKVQENLNSKSCVIYVVAILLTRLHNLFLIVVNTITASTANSRNLCLCLYVHIKRQQELYLFSSVGRKSDDSQWTQPLYELCTVSGRSRFSPAKCLSLLINTDDQILMRENRI